MSKLGVRGNNGNEIRFFVHPNIIQSDKQLEELIKRLARLICNDDKHVSERDSGYRWQLDDSNDWWADIEANNKIIIAYRYAFSPAAAQKMSKLCDTIIWRLNLERFQS